MSLLEQDIIKKKRMNKLFLELKPEFDINNNKEYKIKVIRNSIIYIKKAEKHLISLYYLVFWKNYPKKENT